MAIDKQAMDSKPKSVWMKQNGYTIRRYDIGYWLLIISGSFRKHVNKYAEFVFITAPHNVTIPAASADNSSMSSDSAEDDGNNSKVSDDNASGEGDNQRSWWSNKDDGTFKGTNKNGPAFGFNDSLRAVEEAWQTQGPFQGLLGFSQGACFVGLLCNLSTRGSMYCIDSITTTTIDFLFEIRM